MSDNSDSEYDSEDDEDYVPEEPSSEEEADDGDGSASNKKQTKSKKKKSAGRKRKGGIKLEDEEVSPVEESEDDDEILPTKDRSRVDGDSKRVDDLWAAFKEETSSVRQAGTSSKLETKGEQVKKDDTSTEKIVKVTEIFDFAGEEVRVEKSVDVSSPKVTTDEVGNVGQSRKTLLPSKRPCGGLSSVLGKIGKKPK